jgi:glycosyltransferase involved in cell wall biosynthesis
MRGKLIVLHVVHRLARSGGERQLVDMIRLMPRDRVEHAVCTLYDEGSLKSELEECGVQIFHLQLGGRHNLMQGIWRLQKLISRRQIHIVHLWMIDAVLLGRIAYWLALKQGYKCLLVISPQGSDYAPEVLSSGEHASRWEFLTKKYLDKVTRRFTPQIQIACSEYEKTTYVEHLNVKPEQIRVIHNTTDLSEGYTNLSTAERAKYRAELGEEGFPKIICVSRLIRRKGQDILLKAIPNVATHFPQTIVWLVGEGEYRTTLEHLCRSLAIESHVKFLGLRSDVKRLLHMADLFVFPTLYEPFGIVLIEAMAAGLPCIASRTGAIPEIIQEGYSGFTFTPGSSEELAESIMRLASDADCCEQMGQRARQVVYQRFNSCAAATAYEQIYLDAYREQGLSR